MNSFCSPQPSIDLALRHVPDLSENELVETLSIVVNHPLTLNPTDDPNVMQIDSQNTSQLPSLRGFFATMLQHRKFTTPQLMLAVRHHLRAAEAVTLLVQVVDEWIKKLQAQEPKLLPSKKDVSKNAFGAFVVKEGGGKQKAISNLPSMEQVNSLKLQGGKDKLTRGFFFYSFQDFGFLATSP